MHRRDFLSSIAALPVLAAVDPHQPRPPSTARGGLKLGTVTYNIAKDWDLPTLIKNLSDAEFDAVELRTTHKHGVEIALSPAARAEVRARFADSPVKIGGLGTICEYHSPDAAVLRRNVDETKAWVALAKDLGSPSVKVRPNGLPKDAPEDKTLEQIGKALAECGAFARDHGVKIQLEVHGENTSRVPRIRRSSTTAATIRASKCAGTRTRRICSMAGSTRTSGCCETRSARFTCGISSSTSTRGGH